MSVGTKVVLHVEDNFENLILIRRLLQFNGYQVIEADSVFRAVSILKKYRPDLILMDINLPDIDGNTLTSKLKSIPYFKNIPIVAITANALKGDRERSMKAGYDGYIEKPIDVDLFPEQIENYLNGKNSNELDIFS
jgi:two-component system cell cycle response regulator DivK